MCGVEAAPKRRKVELHAHRGGAGLRPENTVYAFAYALEVGADALEMDTVFTKDGVVSGVFPSVRYQLIISSL